MTTQSLEQQKMLYSRELAAYTLRQWTAVHRALEIQSTRDGSEAAVTRALERVTLGPGEPALSKGHNSTTKTGRRSSASVSKNTHRPTPQESAGRRRRAMMHDDHFQHQPTPHNGGLNCVARA
ncbi:hypothetical protein HYDPIDRAFT_165404 [Hydnomerulius pinastri MD-312]|nr:hypothetical protein HYDPIDRAFT_165404 [Hydnomerulius pinastri MD-312]